MTVFNIIIWPYLIQPFLVICCIHLSWQSTKCSLLCPIFLIQRFQCITDFKNYIGRTRHDHKFYINHTMCSPSKGRSIKSLIAILINPAKGRTSHLNVMDNYNKIIITTLATNWLAFAASMKDDAGEKQDASSGWFPLVIFFPMSPILTSRD